jgi:hypothetical protein
MVDLTPAAKAHLRDKALPNSMDIWDDWGREGAPYIRAARGLRQRLSSLPVPVDRPDLTDYRRTGCQHCGAPEAEPVRKMGSGVLYDCNSCERSFLVPESHATRTAMDDDGLAGDVEQGEPTGMWSRWWEAEGPLPCPFTTQNAEGHRGHQCIWDPAINPTHEDRMKAFHGWEKNVLEPWREQRRKGKP